MRLKRKKEGEEKDGSSLAGGREGNKIPPVEPAAAETIKLGHRRHGGTAAHTPLSHPQKGWVGGSSSHCANFNCHHSAVSSNDPLEQTPAEGERSPGSARVLWRKAPHPERLSLVNAASMYPETPFLH